MSKLLTRNPPQAAVALTKSGQHHRNSSQKGLKLSKRVEMIKKHTLTVFLLMWSCLIIFASPDQAQTSDCRREWFLSPLTHSINGDFFTLSCGSTQNAFVFFIILLQFIWRHPRFNFSAAVFQVVLGKARRAELMKGYFSGICWFSKQRCVFSNI